MSAQPFTDWTSMSTPFAELQKMGQETSEKVIRECISYCSDNTASAVKYSQTMPRLSSAEDYVNLQWKLAFQQGEKAMEFVQNLFQIYQEALRNHMQWSEQKVNTAMKTAGNKGKKEE